MLTLEERERAAYTAGDIALAAAYAARIDAEDELAAAEPARAAAHSAQIPVNREFLLGHHAGNTVLFFPQEQFKLTGEEVKKNTLQVPPPADGCTALREAWRSAPAPT
jgi:hypothetical protein